MEVPMNNHSSYPLRIRLRAILIICYDAESEKKD